MKVNVYSLAMVSNDASLKGAWRITMGVSRQRDRQVLTLGRSSGYWHSWCNGLWKREASVPGYLGAVVSSQGKHAHTSLSPLSQVSGGHQFIAPNSDQLQNLGTSTSTIVVALNHMAYLTSPRGPPRSWWPSPWFPGRHSQGRAAPGHRSGGWPGLRPCLWRPPGHHTRWRPPGCHRWGRAAPGRRSWGWSVWYHDSLWGHPQGLLSAWPADIYRGDLWSPRDWILQYPTTVSPGLVFIEKLQNDDLMMTSFVTLKRPNDYHLKVIRMTSFTFCVVLSGF